MGLYRSSTKTFQNMSILIGILASVMLFFKAPYLSAEGSYTKEDLNSTVSNLQNEAAAESYDSSPKKDCQEEMIEPMAESSCCGYNDSGNTYNCYGCGNCTWWCAYKRPETNFPGSNRYAYRWLELAKQNGLPVGSKPKKGSIAVFDKYLSGSSGYGHVAHVEKVDGDNFTVTEMCYPNGCGGVCCKIGTSTYPLSHKNLDGFIFPDGDENDLPDLNVERVEISEAGKNDWKHTITIQSGESFEYDIEAKIENKGEGDTDDDIKVRYYLSTDKHFNKNEDHRLGEDKIDELKSGEDEEEHLKNLDAPTSPGTYYIFVYIDYDKEEEHSSNNYSDDGDTEEYAVLIVEGQSSDLILENQTISSGQHSFEASNSITAQDNFIITGDAEVVFRAGGLIFFKPGFRADPGCKVDALIDPSLK